MMNKHQQIQVLVVEDDPLVGKMIQGILGEIGCAIVGTATASSQALEMTQALHPDVVLMDIKLSGSDGIEATRQIYDHCPTPVVVLSAYETPELIKKASTAGVGAYLVKPTNASEMERAITVAMARFDDTVSLRRQAAELEALRQASLRLTSSLELQPVLDSLLQQALKLSGADDAHIFLYDGTQLSFGAALWANGTQGQPIAMPRPHGLTHTVASSGERIVIPDASTHPLFADWRWGTDPDVGAIVGLPLRIGERVIGVMNVAFEKPHPFEESELRTLELLAAQAAIAIQNADLYQQVQRHAAELEQRVEERTRELEQANRQLQELDRLKTQFINDISHELRTPATNVRLYLQLLEHGKPEKQARYLSIIKEQTNRMVRLVEDILQFAQLELDKARVDFAAVDLNKVVGEIVSETRQHAASVGLELCFEPATGLAPVRAQSDQLAQVVTNLVDNAIHYTSEGEIRVSTHFDPQRGQACLEVRDTGRGIASEDRPHLFERFYRGQGVGSSTIPGSGLGLAIVKEIVNVHGGEINIESQVGQGSTFRVYWPLHKGNSLAKEE